MDSNIKQIKSYVLRTGRMSPAQKKSYDDLFEDYSLVYKEEYIDLDTIFPNKNVVIEIGFGMGDATWQIAQENPDNGYIGIEVHTPGVGKLLHQMNINNIKNIRVIEHDAVEVIKNMIPENSISGIHIFFPDPWQKKKHHKRRLVQFPFLEMLTKIIKPGGYIYAVTDWEDYANFMLKEFNLVKELENPYKGFATAQDWRPKTKFESKGLDKNHKINEVLFRKK